MPFHILASLRGTHQLHVISGLRADLRCPGKCGQAGPAAPHVKEGQGLSRRQKTVTYYSDITVYLRTQSVQRVFT